MTATTLNCSPSDSAVRSGGVAQVLCNGVPTAVVVYEYKLSAAQELAALAQEFAATAGSKGGAGVSGTVKKAEDAQGKKGGSKSGPRGGNSGSSWHV